MRDVTMDPGTVRRTARDLQTAGEDARAAVRAVEPPADGYAWRGLVDRGITALLDDTRSLARGCERIAEALEHVADDLEETDLMVAETTRGLM